MAVMSRPSLEKWAPSVALTIAPPASPIAAPSNVLIFRLRRGLREMRTTVSLLTVVSREAS